MFGAARTLLFGGITGKALGVARELLYAALFGTTGVGVAYRLAQAGFLIPLHGFLSDAYSCGFTPVYARAHQRQPERARALFAAMHIVTLAVAVAVGAMLALFAGRWMTLLAPGIDRHTGAVATRLVVLLCATMPFYALTGLYAAAELAVGKAGMAAARASAQSLGLIGGALMTWWTGDAQWLAAGFLLAYAALAIWGLLAAHRDGLNPWPTRAQWTLAQVSLREAWIAFRILLLVPALLQLHFLIERRVASLTDPAAIAALDYARFFSDTATLLLAVPFGLAGLGAMAGLSEARFHKLALRSLRMLLYVGAPLSALFVMHAQAIVQLVFARGAFDPKSVAVTATILQTSALGLWAQLLGYAGAKFMSTRGRNGRLMLIYLAAVGANIAINQLLHPFVGVATLGIAAAANALLFGILILQSLKLLTPLWRDLTTVFSLSALYAALWSLAAAQWSVSLWIPFVVFSAYWGSAALLVPRCREVLQDAWFSLRTA